MNERHDRCSHNVIHNNNNNMNAIQGHGYFGKWILSIEPYYYMNNGHMYMDSNDHHLSSYAYIIIIEWTINAIYE
ncbi:hypothetical protein DERF_002829 [Dermatophagoides farinae]|uniref:Uncharacterized protein n=1 Tax=Dermatophagoides farinae TaxID=6954 RepID=A0A922IBE2_DERFA|nr:hypothetical protein DERF_002829 [Dermatophagoides farinae]